MRIGVVSDSHDNIPAIREVLGIFKNSGIEAILHMGDHCSPFTALAWGQWKIPFIGILGNNDGDTALLKERYKEFGEIHQRPHALTLGGRRILMLHEPDNLENLIDGGEYELILYGHTHRINVIERKTLAINPGEACGYITGVSSCFVLDLKTLEYEKVIFRDRPEEALVKRQTS